MAQKNTSGRIPQKTSKDKVIQMPVEKIQKRGAIDYTFLFMVVLVVCVGLVMLLSASAPAARVKYGNPYNFFVKQFIFVVVGFIGMTAMSFIDYKVYKKFAPIIFVVSAILLVLVAIPGIGKEYNGARRWISIAGMDFQPSEIMKVAIAIYFAHLIEERQNDITTFSGSVKFYIIVGIVSGLMFLEPHLSGAIVIAGIGVVIMLVAGTPVKPLCIGVPIVGVLGFTVICFVDPGRLARLMRFWDPFSDLQNTGYQISQALYAIGSGGIFGKGLGKSVQKYSYLPEPYNDFIFAVACEELGLIGAALIILLFGALIFCGFKIALSAPDRFGTLLGVGIMAQVAIQTVLNIAVATSSVPNTGVSLPFFSSGGSSVMMLLCEMGILLNISRYSTKNK